MNYVVVDVYALAYRALYGYPKLTNKAGKPTSVIIGFFKQFLSRIDDVDNYYPIFVADSHNDTYRTQLLPTYKGNRTKQEDSFYEQIDFVLSICSRIGTVYRIAGYEADDLAACFLTKYLKPEDTCMLLTVDQDWLQMLSRNVSVYQLKTNQVHVHWTDELFFKEWGFVPKQLADFKALVGDSSDNIAGVKGIGPKQATELIKEFETVENMYANIIKIPNKRNVQTNLIENEATVKINKQIVTLNSSINELPAPNTVVTQDSINSIIDEFEAATNAVDLLNILGLYLQHRKTV